MIGLTRDTILYRPWRLRRLVIAALLIPAPALAWTGWLGAPGGATLGVFWALTVLVYVEVFPNGWTDLLSIAVTVALTILAIPLIAPFDLNPGQVILVGLVGLTATWLGANLAIGQLDNISAPIRKIYHSCRLPLDAEAARAAFFMRPDATVGQHICGPLAEDGTFEVMITAMPMPIPLDDMTPFQAKPDAPMPVNPGADTPFRMRAKVISTDAYRQETMVFAEITQGKPDVSTVIETLTPVPGGTLYEKREMAPRWSLLALLGFWLNDFDGDTVTNTLDRWEGRPSRANRSASGESLLTLTARMITALETTPQKR